MSTREERREQREREERELERREEQRRIDARRRKMRERRKAQVRRQMMMCGAAVVVLLLVIILGGSCGDKRGKDKEDSSGNKIEATGTPTPSPSATPSVEPTGEAPSQKEDLNTLHLIAVGDNLIHERVGNSGKNDTGVWNYDHLYQYVKEDVSAADLAIAVQETIFVKDHADFTGYPSFGTPTEVADALVNSGFDVITHATNHTMDKGADAVRFTIEWWKQNQSQIAVLGIHENEQASKEITVVECKSFKIAMLNYTQLLNFNPNMKGKEYLVDIYDEASARADIRRAKELADLVLVVMHVGTEYVSEIDSATKNMTNVFLEEGVDIVLGSHPHVIRPFETLTRADGHEMLVYYSLGNFISCQNELAALLGGMADIVIKRDETTGDIYVESAKMIPLMTHYNHDTKTYAVYKLEDYTKELMLNHSAYQANTGTFSLDYYNNLYQSVLK